MHKFIALTTITLGIAAIGLIGHSDHQVQLESAMASTCTQSAQHMNMYADQCQALINEVQADGHHEVLSNDQGLFWTEEHK